MKKIIAAISFLAVVCGTAYAASIGGSKHDLSSASMNGGIYSVDQSQICIFCHSPHGMMSMLWNRTLPSETSISSYLLYTSSDSLSMAARGAVIDSQSTSLLCLSCHDGTLAEIGSRVITNSPVGAPINMVDNLGTWGTSGVLWNGSSLANHPIGFDYAAAQAQKPDRLHTISEVNAVLGASGNVFDRSTATSPYYTSLECSTCHTVHDPANPDFLRRSNSDNAFCLACHIMY